MSEYGEGIAYSPYEDFNPNDPDEVELVEMATGLDRLASENRRSRELENEVARLRALLAENGIEYEE